MQVCECSCFVSLNSPHVDVTEAKPLFPRRLSEVTSDEPVPLSTWPHTMVPTLQGISPCGCRVVTHHS